MAKHIPFLPLLALLIACGGAPEAASPADADDATTPVAAEPSCADLDQTKCQITAGCAWAADDSGCAVDKVNAFAP